MNLKKFNFIEFLIGLLLFIIIVLVIIFFIDNIIYFNNFDKNINDLESTYTYRNFSVDKILIYSSANAINSDNYKSSLNISQFSDIAIFINNNSKSR